MPLRRTRKHVELKRCLCRLFKIFPLLHGRHRVTMTQCPSQEKRRASTVEINLGLAPPELVELNHRLLLILAARNGGFQE